jgi:hypothetical protein
VYKITPDRPWRMEREALIAKRTVEYSSPRRKRKDKNMENPNPK